MANWKTLLDPKGCIKKCPQKQVTRFVLHLEYPGRRIDKHSVKTNLYQHYFNRNLNEGISKDDKDKLLLINFKVNSAKTIKMTRKIEQPTSL